MTGNQEKAQQTCEAWAQTYPHDHVPHAYLARMIYDPSGKFEKAVEEAQKAIEINPDFSVAYHILGCSYQYLNRFEEAGKTFERAAARKSSKGPPHTIPAHANADHVEQGEVGLPIGETLVGCFAVPLGRLDHIPIHAVAVGIHQGQLALRVRVALFRGLLIPL